MTRTWTMMSRIQNAAKYMVKRVNESWLPEPHWADFAFGVWWFLESLDGQPPKAHGLVYEISRPYAI